MAGLAYASIFKKKTFSWVSRRGSGAQLRLTPETQAPAAHTLAAVRNSRWLLPYACRGSDARVPAAAQRVAAWPAQGWWILKKNTLLAAAPLFLKLKMIIIFNIQKSKFYPAYDYISFYSSCIPFSFLFWFFSFFLFFIFFFIYPSSLFCSKRSCGFPPPFFLKKKRTFFQFCLVFFLALSYTCFFFSFLDPSTIWSSSFLFSF